MTRVLVCIPTYDERETLPVTLRRLRSAVPDADVLIVPLGPRRRDRCIGDDLRSLHLPDDDLAAVMAGDNSPLRLSKAPHR